MQYVAIRWKLRELLEREEVSVMQLSEHMPSNSKPESLRVQLYTVTSPDPSKHPKRVEFAFLYSILEGLRSLKERRFELSDLLDYRTEEEEVLG